MGESGKQEIIFVPNTTVNSEPFPLTYEPERGLGFRDGQRGWIDHQGMAIDMLDALLATLSQVQEFMAGTADVPFRVLDSRAERYALVQRLLARLGWTRLRRADKTLLRTFLGQVTGLFPAQLTRLIGHVWTGVVRGRLSGTREYLPRALRRHRRDRIDKTRSGPRTIAIRRAPQPDGMRRHHPHRHRPPG